MSCGVTPFGYNLFLATFSISNGINPLHRKPLGTSSNETDLIDLIWSFAARSIAREVNALYDARGLMGTASFARWSFAHGFFGAEFSGHSSLARGFLGAKCSVCCLAQAFRDVVASPTLSFAHGVSTGTSP